MENSQSHQIPRRFSVGVGAAHRGVTVDGVFLAYDERGQGFPVVALHAVSHGSRDFEHIADPLAAQWRFITFDWPGHGRSGADTQPVTLARYTRLLAGFLDALKIERVVLIGNSIGGSAAMAYAASFPERVAALVLADPGGLRPMDRLSYRVCGAMAALGRAGARRAFYFTPLFALMYRQYLRTPAAGAQRRRIVHAAAETAAIWEQAWLGFRTAQADQAAIGSDIRCPVLFAWCRQDRVIPFRASKAAVSRFPDHRVSFFNGGHCPHLEDPQAFVSAVRAFLQQVKTAPPPSDALRVPG